MTKFKDTDLHVVVLNPGSSKCSIKFDEHLDALLDAQGIEESDGQMIICNALCDIGLAEHKMFTDDKLGTQEHHDTSTGMMKKLAKEWLYSTKHWFPSDE
jgi:hypothetical protein